MSLAKELGGHFIETSAKAGVNIKQLFVEISSCLPGMDSKKTPEGEGTVETGNAGGQNKFALKKGENA